MNSKSWVPLKLSLSLAQRAGLTTGDDDPDPGTVILSAWVCAKVCHAILELRAEPRHLGLLCGERAAHISLA